MERFLARHAESSMIIRSNLRRVGVAYEGAAYQGEYKLAIDAHNEIIGILVHYWNGSLMVQAPDEAALCQLLYDFRASRTRSISCVMGPSTQVTKIVQFLSLDENTFSLNAYEDLFSLDLVDLHCDGLNLEEQVVEARSISRDLLWAWMKAYEMEALGAQASEALDVRLEDRISRMSKFGDAWALLQAGSPVSLSGFNARLPDMVQVGPVWTPPEFRNRGYARRLVAETLRMARAEGVNKAILFTDNPAAAKAYRALGFEVVGEFRLAFLKE